jgi:hypothetical protein
VVQVSVQRIPPDAAADREPGPARDGSGDLQPVLKRVVRGVPAGHEATCLSSAVPCRRGHRDGVVVPVLPLDRPERWLQAVVLQVLHDPQSVPGPQFLVVTIRVAPGRFLVGAGGGHQEFDDQRPPGLRRPRRDLGELLRLLLAASRVQAG